MRASRVLAAALAQALLLLCGYAAFAHAQQPEAAAKSRTSALADARRAINDGRPKDAITTLQGLGDPTSPEVAHLLGVAYYHADNYPQAIATLTGLADRFPDGSIERREIVQVLGLSLFVSGRYADALPLLEETRRWASDNLELGYVLGQAYIQVEQAARARETLASVFGVPPASPGAHLIVAQMMIRLEHEALAEAELKQAIEKQPDLPRAHLLLGQIALFRGRLDDSIALTRKELAISPGDAMAFYQLGDALVRQSNWDAAIGSLQQSLWINPFYSGPYILLGKAYMRKGQAGTAEGMLRRAVQYDPNNRTAHYLLAQLLQQSGRPEEAKREFEIAERLQGATLR
ncbi:MAG: tetratricopeptide repeat protein [Acidobacteriota bacterium]